MLNIAKALKEEIQKVARRQVRAEIRAVRRENARLRRSVAMLRRQLGGLQRTSKDLVKRVMPAVATKEAEEATTKARTLRPTSEGLKKLRARLGLTQAQFGQLLGVSAQAVVQWAAKQGRIRLRKATLAKLANIRQIGKREARRRLEALAAAPPPAKAKRKGEKK